MKNAQLIFPITSMKREVPHASATINLRVRTRHWSPVPLRDHRSQRRRTGCGERRSDCHCRSVNGTAPQRCALNHDGPDRQLVSQCLPTSSVSVTASSSPSVSPTSSVSVTLTSSPSVSPSPSVSVTDTPTPEPTTDPSEPTIVEIPQVTGPLTSTRKSHPFGAAQFQGVRENLQRKGYVEEEYIISGTANVYDWPAPGPAVVRTADAPYTTRILVRKPIKRSDFSGNVVVEPMNPSNLFDLNIGWAMMNRQMVENGDVWVGVTVKPVSIVALKKFDPERYASLSMANPLSLDDPLNCEVSGSNDRASENGLAWDIISQTGQLVRSTDARNPIRYGVKHRTEQVYGLGYSQTGGYLYDYINGIRPQKPVPQSDLLQCHSAQS